MRTEYRRLIRSMAVKPSKDDLHQWSIFRQNLNSSMANTLLNVPGYRENEVLPFGSFRMSEQAVQGVLEAGRSDERDIPTEPGTYLRFGLPRVLVGNNVGDATLQKPANRNVADKPGRRTQSETRRENSNTPTRETSNCLSPLSGGTHYAESDIATVFNRAGHQSPVIPLSMSRHHRPYFSNLDLVEQSKGYNYLKYAKAEELRRSVKSSPHIQITNLGFNHDLRTTFDKAMLRGPKYLRTIDGVTLELYAGDTMTLMYTSELEMRTILGILSNQHTPSGKIDGTLEINGHRVTTSQFGERCAYVGIDEPCPWLTVQQFLSFSCAFYKPATDAFEINRMIDQLIHTLALTPFRNQLCRDLGRTERQRLKIASAVIMDTDILICDNIVRDMDIYDVAFIVDYLRDWAIKLSRIVIIAMSPPTVEILTMFQKCAILASGHFVYFGHTHQMVDYFESIGHPCPQFKNPCDYYVDLVTLDHLTAESSAESMERIQTLAELWEQKAAPLDIPTTAPVSPRKRPRFAFYRAWSIYKRFWILLYNRPGDYLFELVLALVLSVVVGFIFYELPTDQRAGIEDRFGALFVSLCLILYPSIECCTQRVFNERRIMYNDIIHKNYASFTYIVVKFILLSVPIYLIMRLNPQTYDNIAALCLFTLVITANALLLRHISLCFAYFFSDRTTVTGAQLCALALLALSSGFFTHPEEQHSYAGWLAKVNPIRISGQMLVEMTFLESTPWLEKAEALVAKPARVSKNGSHLQFDCVRKHILATKIKEVCGRFDALIYNLQIPIYTVSQCSRISGDEVYQFSGFNTSIMTIDHREMHYSNSLLIWLAWQAAAFILLVFCAQRVHRPPPEVLYS
uniref:ABC transporter domain-containing protein n=1 Tax=Steinernema glaseri TaxID=37863 RepID=A0A1I7YQX6_9BILA